MCLELVFACHGTLSAWPHQSSKLHSPPLQPSRRAKAMTPNRRMSCPFQTMTVMQCISSATSYTFETISCRLASCQVCSVRSAASLTSTSVSLPPAAQRCSGSIGFMLRRVQATCGISSKLRTSSTRRCSLHGSHHAGFSINRCTSGRYQSLRQPTQ